MHITGCARYGTGAVFGKNRYKNRFAEPITSRNTDPHFYFCKNPICLKLAVAHMLLFAGCVFAGVSHNLKLISAVQASFVNFGAGAYARKHIFNFLLSSSVIVNVFSFQENPSGNSADSVIRSIGRYARTVCAEIDSNDAFP